MVSGSTKKLFIGMKLEKQLDRMFEEKKTLYATYIQGRDADCLKVVTIGGSKFIGKVVEQGLPTARIPDICRHIRSVVAKLPRRSVATNCTTPHCRGCAPCGAGSY